jgi:hypothetical protein
MCRTQSCATDVWLESLHAQGLPAPTLCTSAVHQTSTVRSRRSLFLDPLLATVNDATGRCNRSPVSANTAYVTVPRVKPIAGASSREQYPRVYTICRHEIGCVQTPHSLQGANLTDNKFSLTLPKPKNVIVFVIDIVITVNGPNET